MSEPVLMMETAIGLIRRFSGMKGFPKYDEGEQALAEVLVFHTEGVNHAGAAVAEFDDRDCPTVSELRSAAIRLGEKCKCGSGRWAHPRPNCQRFFSVDDEDFPPPAKILNQVKQFVPLLPGVPWEVCLQVQCLRIYVRDPRSDMGKGPEYERWFSEALKDIRAGLDPDYGLVTKRMAEKAPHAFRGLAIPGAVQQINEQNRLRSAREIARPTGGASPGGAIQ